ncbi:NUDIX domain-containing protein [Arthrobacter sp. B3I4]|uniref:NUDIX domain-containing protein n=1 Tax=Arthrobacter sp. B3I4 TaxID=3042267 RepID=UPI00277E135B|nr:8-oxo-dGTP diphosphatase [Arthrobacter sp. B3I4]
MDSSAAPQPDTHQSAGAPGGDRPAGTGSPESPPAAKNPYLEPRRPLGPRDPGDAWVEGEHGRFWGRFGSAGLLVHDAAKGVLLQHRATWSDQGGTWGLPGGALHQGEDAVDGALREAKEEAAVPPASVRVLFTSVFDVGYWSYTTVAAQVVEPFEPVISDPESLELQWVDLDGVGEKNLHPGFAAAWPALRRRLDDGHQSSN